MIFSVKHIALNKVIFPLQGLFFQGEGLGMSPIERCTDCKLRMSQCRICGSETALLMEIQEEEYNILKEIINIVRNVDIYMLSITSRRIQVS